MATIHICDRCGLKSPNEFPYPEWVFQVPKWEDADLCAICLDEIHEQHIKAKDAAAKTYEDVMSLLPEVDRRKP